MLRVRRAALTNTTMMLAAALLRAQAPVSGAQSPVKPTRAATGPLQTPEQRAIDYLAREVPRWFFENHCYSCHNNGDAARALYIARQQRRELAPGAFAGTSNWLNAPVRWDHNASNPAFNDKKLARIQFAAALAEAWKAGATKREWAVFSAARLVAIEQSRDGSWTVDADADIGSPATWGTPLATYMARHALEAADARVFDSYITKANAWLAAYQPAATFGSAVKLLALPRDKESSAKLVESILAAQTSDGGWGPRLHAPSEPFDTAVVLLALQGALRQAGSRQQEVAQAIARGRGYLIATQERDGGWPETTRPPGGHSYAQHISTSGWATQALLVTDKGR
jgi:hypothetical protein